MRSRADIALITCLLACVPSARPASLHPLGPDPGSWARILGSVGFEAGSPDGTRIFVARPGQTAVIDLAGQVEAGAYLILEADTAAGRSFGFEPGTDRVRVVSVEDTREPKLDIVWERAEEVRVFRVPAAAEVLARDRTSGAPLVACMRHGAGGILWTAVSPGPLGHEKFPFLLDALASVGLRSPFRSNRLWAFFDSSYRLRADMEYLANRWVAAGIRGLHVAAWHYYEPDAQREAYLRDLIATCHRRGILVYAWLELPHVSEKFWADHPDWREKTALLHDAHLDWRKLMNLANPACAASVAEGIEALLGRFDWDGANLAEFYFESLQGHDNPSRFTPMNDDVRRRFQEQNGFDPLLLFAVSSPRYHPKNPRALRQFLNLRADLAREIQTEWLERISSMNGSRSELDIVLTHVDDRLDRRMRDAVGADAEAILPLLDRRGFTFLVEDPATVWNLGPDRYRKLAESYAALTRHRDRLAIDLNIVERYQDVYPTKQQAGIEMLQLVSQAARNFSRVALYSENSIRPRDVGWLSSAAAAVQRCERRGGALVVDSPHPAGVRWAGEALLDGKLWPASDGEWIWFPAGRHVILPAKAKPAVRLLDFTGELTSATSLANGIEFHYFSLARAYAVLDKSPRLVEVDGRRAEPRMLASPAKFTLQLPRGEHTIRVQVTM